MFYRADICKLATIGRQRASYFSGRILEDLDRVAQQVCDDCAMLLRMYSWSKMDAHSVQIGPTFDTLSGKEAA